MKPGESSLPTRLKAGLPGLGEAAQVDIERRAAELARTDGREFVTDADLARGARELAAAIAPAAAPETSHPALAEITAWDDPVDQSGHRVDKMPLEDEAPVAERLIQDGLAEADHDTRVAAADEEVR